MCKNKKGLDLIEKSKKEKKNIHIFIRIVLNNKNITIDKTWFIIIIFIMMKHFLLIHSKRCEFLSWIYAKIK